MNEPISTLMLRFIYESTCWQISSCFYANKMLIWELHECKQPVPSVNYEEHSLEELRNHQRTCLTSIINKITKCLKYDSIISQIYSSMCDRCSLLKMPITLLSLTLWPLIENMAQYANSLDPDETPSNSASHPDPSCFTLGQHFLQRCATLKHFEN